MPRYIDANALLARYKERCEGCKETKNYCEHCCDIADVIDDIEDAPTADVVERKKGQWMPCAKNGLILTELTREESVAKWYGYKCSECNYIHKGNALIEYSYCPNCGADMRGEQDAEIN